MISETSLSIFIHTVIRAALSGISCSVYFAVEYIKVLHTAIKSLLVALQSWTPFIYSMLILFMDLSLLCIALSSITFFHGALIQRYDSASLILSLFLSAEIWSLHLSYLAPSTQSIWRLAILFQLRGLLKEGLKKPC